MTDKIEEIRKALEGATPGPWRWQEHTADGIESVLEPYMCQAEGFIEVSGPNARLIALAPDMARIVLAAEKLAETHKAMLRMMDDALKGTGQGDMAILPDHSLTLIEAWKRDAAYRKAVEGGE